MRRSFSFLALFSCYLYIFPATASAADFQIIESTLRSSVGGINNSGQLAGQFIDDAAGRSHGFIRFPTGEVVTFDPSESTWTNVNGINDGGLVAGTFRTATSFRGYIRQPNGTFTLFDAPAGLYLNEVIGINQSGQVAGAVEWYELTGQGLEILHSAFIRETNGTFTLFDAMGNGPGWVNAINNAGQTTGVLGYQGYLRQANGQMITFDAPDADYTTPRAINNLGDIAGDMWNPQHGSRGFIRLNNGAFIVFEEPQNDLQIAGINDNGVVTGKITTTLLGNLYQFGFVRTPDGVMTFFDPINSDSSSPVAINNKGEIAGVFYNEATNFERAFLRGATPKKEAAFDFGSANGVWIWQNNSAWSQTHALSPERMATGDLDGNGIEDIVMDFGPQYGIWLWMNNAVWEQLHALTSEDIVIGDVDGNGLEDVVIDFGPANGLWIRLNNAAWTQLHALSPVRMASGNLDGLVFPGKRDDVVIDFGPANGVWAWMNNTSWVQIHNLSTAAILIADLDCNGKDDIVFDFGAPYGVWKRMNNVVWERLHTSSPLTMTAGDLNGDGADDVIMDFGPPYGIWIWSGNTFWIPWQTIGLVKSMATVDLNGDGWDELIADFGPFGVYTWRIVQGWTLFHPLSPEAIVTGELAP